MNTGRPRPLWLDDEMCGWIYNALAQAYSSKIERADEFHRRWKAATTDPVEAVLSSNARLLHISDPNVVASAACNALGMPKASA